MTQVTVKTFFNEYWKGGMSGSEFSRLSPAQQLQAQFDFIGARVTYITDQPYPQEGELPPSIWTEAHTVLHCLKAAQIAVDQGDLYEATMTAISIGRFMERMTSGQLGMLAIKYKERPETALGEKNRKLSEAKKEVINIWLSAEGGSGARKTFAPLHAERLKKTGIKISERTIRGTWLSKSSIADHLAKKN